ncbi:MAG: hypothetical protein M3R55_09635 [Acidobacteriota bacterium]|nr:hypothetical protein [Acidobacteriota bacterium]
MLLVAATILAAIIPLQAPAPAQTSQAGRLRVFLDCDCFQSYAREEVSFVDYVRDRESADVHVLGQSRETGGGGREYALRFVGAGRLAGTDLDLKAVTAPGDTEDARRRAVASTLRVGFLAYLAKSGLPAHLDIQIDEDEQVAPAAGISDPWNFWVYSVRASTELQAEESSREWNWQVSGSADRVTRDWKLSFGGEVDQTIEKFDLDEDEPLTSRRHNREINTLAVKSLGEHWSAGMLSETSSSSFENRKFQFGAAPAVEYNFFPYSAYTRRQLRAKYYVGPVYSRYYEVTLFDKLEETRVLHAAEITLDQREPWGTLQAQFEVQQYLPKASQYRVEFNGDVSIRITRGLSVSIEGGASRIRDQISLPKRGATSEEVLLRLRRLRSGFEYNFDVGFTYTFGSIFNNIVNPRFGS